MYNYDFKNEPILNELLNVTVLFNDKNITCNIVLTQKNILFFLDSTQDNYLRQTRGVNYMPMYELILKLPFDIKKEIKDNNTIINYENNVITIFDITL